MPPSPFRLLGHTRLLVVGSHDSEKSDRVSLVTLMTQCVARMGLRLRASSEHSPLAWTEMLPSSMQKPWAGSNRKPSFRSSIPFRAGRYSLPFILTTFLCTLQPETSAIRLIRWLQHSILGLWLAVTQAGLTPARLQTISSPHVHRMVLLTLRAGAGTRISVVKPRSR